MSNYSALKTDINNNIYENNTQQITGTILNTVLKDMVNTLGAGYQFAGCAYLDLNPGAPDAKVFYLAGEGLYTNFDNIQVPAGKLGILKWDTRWHLETIEGLGGGGANLTGYVSLASTDDLPDEGVATLGYLCGENLYLYVGEGGDTKEGKYQNCGSFRGPQGDSVQDVEQTQTSLENGGVNKIKFTLSNGVSCEFQVRNGTTSSGLFPTLAALQAAYPSPVVGQYAFVGAGFPADIYVCTTAGTWTDSGEDYDGDNVDLTDYATKAEVTELEHELYSDGTRDVNEVFHATVGSNINYADSVFPCAIANGTTFKVTFTGDSTKITLVTGLYTCDANGDNRTQIIQNPVFGTTYEKIASGDITHFCIFVHNSQIAADSDLGLQIEIAEDVGDIPKIYDRLSQSEQDIEDLQGEVASLWNDVDGLADELNRIATDTNQTIFENTGQISYYEGLNTDTGFAGICSYATVEEEATVNRIQFPPFRCESQDVDVKYYIAYGQRVPSAKKPNTYNFVKQGVIKKVSNAFVENFVLELDTNLTLPSGNSLFVFLYAETGKVRILGGGNSDTLNPRYNAKDAAPNFLGANNYDSPFDKSWSIASTGDSAKYYVCNPILKYYEESAVKQSVEALVPDVVEEAVSEDKKVEVSLPDKIYAVVGDTLQLFYRGIVLAVNPYDFDIRIVCAKGARYARYFEYTPTAGDVGTVTFKIDVLDKKGYLVGTKTCDLVTVAAPSSPASAKKILCFGDSLTESVTEVVNHGAWCAEADRRLTGTGGTPAGKSLTNIAFCGKLQNGSTGYYGAGGWDWGSYISKGKNAFRFEVSGVTSVASGAVYSNNGHQYTVSEVNVTEGSGTILCMVESASDTPEASGTLTKVSGTGDAIIDFSDAYADVRNPLWDLDNNKMSFIPYATDYSGGQIDAVYVLLGWNGQTPFKTDFSAMMAKVKTFADTLHSEFPSAKLKIMGIQAPNQKDMHGYGANGGYSDKYGMTYTALMLNEAYQAFANQDGYSSWVEFVNVSSQFDSEYNSQVTNKAVNVRNTETEVVGSNGVHPAMPGYMQIADVVYRNIVAEFCQS